MFWAGDNSKYAAHIGWENYTKLHIRKRIAELFSGRSKHTRISQEHALKILEGDKILKIRALKISN